MPNAQPADSFEKGGLGWLMIDCGTRYPGGHLWLAFSSSPAEGTSSGVLWLAPSPTTLAQPRALTGLRGVTPGLDVAWDDKTSAGAVPCGVDRPAQAVSEAVRELRGVLLGGGGVHF